MSATWTGHQGYSGGGVLGGVLIANVSSSECYLADPPVIRLFGENGEDLGIDASSGDACFSGLTCTGRLFRALKPLGDTPAPDYVSSTGLRVSWISHDIVTGRCDPPAPEVRGLELLLPGIANGIVVEPGKFPIEFKPCMSRVGVSSYDGEVHSYPLGYELTQSGPYAVVGEDLTFTANLLKEYPDLPVQFVDQCPTFRILLMTDDQYDDAEPVVISDSTVQHCLSSRILLGDELFSFEVSVAVPSDVEWGMCCRVEMYLAPDKQDWPSSVGVLGAVVYDKRTAEQYEDFVRQSLGVTPTP